MPPTGKVDGMASKRMTLDEEIAWWTKRAVKSDDAGMISFGVATGLKLAKADYGACDDAVLASNRAAAALQRRRASDRRP
jgi:hypothetical protein